MPKGWRGAPRPHASAGAAVETVLADLGRAGRGRDGRRAAREAFGRIDQLVSNAGKAEKARFGEFGTPELDRAFAVNTRPFLELVTAARADLERSDWGRVVAISSFVVNDIGINGVIFPATAAAKAAVEALARTLAFQFAPLGVTVNCVAPGYTRKVGRPRRPRPRRLGSRRGRHARPGA